MKRKDRSARPETLRKSSIRSLLIAGLLSLSVPVLLIATGYGLVGNVIRNRDVNGIQYSQPFKFLSYTPTVTYLIQSIDPTARLLRGVLTVYMPMGAQGRLIDANSRKTLALCAFDPYHCETLPQFGNRRVTIYVTAINSKKRSFQDFQKVMRLRDFNFDHSITNRVSIPLDLPLDGFPEFYPSDFYNVDLTMNMIIDKTAMAGDTLFTQSTYGQKEQFQPGTLQAQWNVIYQHPPCITPRVPAAYQNLPGISKRVCFYNSYEISIQRTTSQILFVYVCASIPLIFSIVFIDALFFRSPREPLSAQEFMLPLVAAVLAVLPIRVVLVPGDILGLTRVDFVLGFGLTCIVAIGIARYVVDTFHRNASPSVADSPEQ